MSIGVGGFANLELQDEQAMIYSYGGFNLNVPELRNPDHIADGIITIRRDALVEPEIHEKIRRRPSGRKVLERKIIPVDPDYGPILRSGGITVENSRYSWNFWYNNVDSTAITILDYIFHEYQMSGKIMERVFFYG